MALSVVYVLNSLGSGRVISLPGVSGDRFNFKRRVAIFGVGSGSWYSRVEGTTQQATRSTLEPELGPFLRFVPGNDHVTPDIRGWRYPVQGYLANNKPPPPLGPP